MDPERQPLLRPSTSDVRIRYRPLTYEEVLASRHEAPWRRFRLLLVLMFWGTIAMFISMIVCILITAPKCGSSDLGPAPSVPPSHLTLAPLVLQGRLVNDNVYVF